MIIFIDIWTQQFYCVAENLLFKLLIIDQQPSPSRGKSNSSPLCKDIY